MALVAAAMRGRPLTWWLRWSPRHPCVSWDAFTTVFLWQFKPEWRIILPLPDDEEDIDASDSLHDASESVHVALSNADGFLPCKELIPSLGEKQLMVEARKPISDFKGNLMDLPDTIMSIMDTTKMFGATTIAVAPGELFPTTELIASHLVTDDVRRLPTAELFLGIHGIPPTWEVPLTQIGSEVVDVDVPKIEQFRRLIVHSNDSPEDIIDGDAVRNQGLSLILKSKFSFDLVFASIGNNQARTRVHKFKNRWNDLLDDITRIQHDSRLVPLGKLFGKVATVRRLLKFLANLDNAWAVSAHGCVTALLNNCRVLRNLVGVEEIKSFMVEEGVVSMFIRLMKSKEEAIQVHSIGFIQNIALGEGLARPMVITESGICALLSVLDPKWSYSSKTREIAMRVMVSLCFSGTESNWMGYGFVNQLLYYVSNGDVSIQELALKVAFKLCETSKEVKIAMSQNSHAMPSVFISCFGFYDKLDGVSRHGTIKLAEVPNSKYVTLIGHFFHHTENMSQRESQSVSTGDEDLSVVVLTSTKYPTCMLEIGVCTASLINRWQGVGFIQGVLHTDNMNILGFSIVYGPFGFLAPFDPTFTPNNTHFPIRKYCVTYLISIHAVAVPIRSLKTHQTIPRIEIIVCGHMISIYALHFAKVALNFVPSYLSAAPLYEKELIKGAIKMIGYILTASYAACYNSQFLLLDCNNGIVTYPLDYIAILGDTTIKTCDFKLDFSNFSSGLIVGSYITWTLGSDGSKSITIKISWDTSIGKELQVGVGLGDTKVLEPLIVATEFDFAYQDAHGFSVAMHLTVKGQVKSLRLLVYAAIDVKWDPGGDSYFFHVKGSLHFKQWDPGRCSYVHWAGPLDWKATWKHVTILQQHSPNFNLEDKVGFNGGGNVMILVEKVGSANEGNKFVTASRHVDTRIVKRGALQRVNRGTYNQMKARGEACIV